MSDLIKFAPYLLMFVVLYFFMIMPAQKKAKREKEFAQSLKVGDKIITIGGIHGKVVELSEATLVIETMSGKLKIDRSAISVEKTASIAVKKA
ncbi:preprotein translocase subunit YajC [Flavobacterium geliluteum]|uniref:Sec translocon accessory complex subunit YajC n=1 Tax=Flavobacterium geliluteum TaxID=2816120 RepID=A0A940XD19_9FLAO|nr:preprotein translocase subunit YajC [Flavobacterium geliluteum]MBP4137540.1 preprotein translocase subunit YajC [Flavobacterium geliluteum]